MTMSEPVEFTRRYATSVQTLAEAWGFVMDRLDSVGADPTIEIKPRWIISVSDAMNDDEMPPREFGVVVSGMIREVAGDGRE